MPFRLKKSESATKGVRRVCRERIGVARARLREGGHSAAIHDARREIKKLRAIFRLVRAAIGRGACRKGARALRKAADYLAAPRDARVMLKAFEKLTEQSARRFGGIERALRKNAQREAKRFRKNNSRKRAERLLRKTDRRLDDLKIKASGWKVIKPGLQRSYFRGREACELAQRKPLPENFHDWRKQVKNLWYFFQLLCAAWPAEMRPMTDALELLAGQLGEDHDLFLLQQFVAMECGGRAGEVEALNRLIESRQKQLRADALKLGARLYAETPAAICRTLERNWNNWRGK